MSSGTQSSKKVDEQIELDAVIARSLAEADEEFARAIAASLVESKPQNPSNVQPQPLDTSYDEDFAKAIELSLADSKDAAQNVAPQNLPPLTHENARAYCDGMKVKIQNMKFIMDRERGLLLEANECLLNASKYSTLEHLLFLNTIINQLTDTVIGKKPFIESQALFKELINLSTVYGYCDRVFKQKTLFVVYVTSQGFFNKF
jgi:hypothetical protein